MITQVELNKDYSDELYSSIKSLLIKAVEDTQRQTAINQPWLRGRRAICKWLSISDQTLTKLELAGLPSHQIDNLNVQFYSKKEVSKFLLEH